MSPVEIRKDLADKTGAFTMAITDGRRFEIKHTDYILVSPSGESCAFYPDGGGLTVIATRQIASLEFKGVEA